MVKPEKIDLTKGSAVKKVLVLSVPLVISHLMHVMYNITDTVWLGALGKEEVAAMAFAFPVIFLIISIGIGIGMAGSILVAQYEGAGMKERVNHVAAQTYMLSVFLSVIISLIGYFFCDEIVALLGAQPEVTAMAVSYLRVMFMGLVFMFGFFIFSALMRGWGNTRTPMKIMVYSNILNMILDPLLIFGVWVFPRMGIAGAAWATVVSRFLASVVGIYILFKGQYSLSVNLKDLKPDIKVMLKILGLGWPPTVGHACRSLGFMLIISIVARFGTVYAAAYGIGIRVFSVFVMPSLAIGMGAASGVGQNVGAGLKERAMKLTIDIAMLVFGILAFFAVILFLFSEPIARVFISGGKYETVAAAAEFLRRLALAAPLLGATMTMRGAFQGAGRTVQAMMIGITGLLLVRVPTAYILARIFASPTGVWNAFIISAGVELLISIIYHRRSNWAVSVIKKPVIGNLAFES